MTEECRKDRQGSQGSEHPGPERNAVLAIAWICRNFSALRSDILSRGLPRNPCRGPLVMEESRGFFHGAEAEVVVERIVVSVGFILTFATLLFPSVKPSRLHSRIPRSIVNSESTFVDIATFTAKCSRLSAIPCRTTANDIPFILRTGKTSGQGRYAQRVASAFHGIFWRLMILGGRNSLRSLGTLR